MNRAAFAELLAALLTVLYAGSAVAQARPGSSCTFGGGGVAFGLFDPTSAANLDTTGSLTVDCNANITVTVSLGRGYGTGAAYGTGRKMTRSGGGTLTYNLYANSTWTQVFGDGTGGSYTHDLSVRRNQTFSQPVWARIPKGQGGTLGGSYSDTVVATISY
jgi:spore coat protein U-like protein